MTAITPARCGSNAVHPPHPIDGSTPGVADCDGFMRRATDTEMAQARAWVAHYATEWHDSELPTAARDQEYEHALEILIHANGGRFGTPIDWDKVLRERDSLARRLAGRFAETERLRAQIAVLEASPRAWAPSQGQDIPNDQLVALLRQWATARWRPDADPSRVADLNEQLRDAPLFDDERQLARSAYRIGYAAALGYEISIVDGRVGVGDRVVPEERAPAVAVGRCGEAPKPLFDGAAPVTCALPAGHAGWHRSDGGTEWGIPAERDRLVAAVLDAAIVWRQCDIAEAGPGAPVNRYERDLVAAVDAMLDARRDLRDEPVVLAEGSVTGPALEYFPDEVLRALNAPVTPAAELADEAAHERVARAIQGALWPNNASDPDVQRNTYAAAKAAIDAYRAGQPIDMDGTLAVLQRAALDAARNLEAGLYERQLLDTLPSDRAAGELVRIALAHIDRLSTALDEAAREQLDECELISDTSLTTDQEIRARAIDAAVRMTAPPDTQETTLAVARVLEAYIRDGADDPWDATNGQRRYCEGYAEAVRRLRDESAYDTWWAGAQNPAGTPSYGSPALRRGIATYLEATAPNPDGPWADQAPGKAAPTAKTWIDELLPGRPLTEWQRAVLLRAMEAPADLMRDLVLGYIHTAPDGTRTDYPPNEITVVVRNITPDEALASKSPRCTCNAGPGEHPHTARGCDIKGCGCRWTPPPINDADKPYAGYGGTP